MRIAAIVVMGLMTGISKYAAAQGVCPRGNLPAYSHNDYQNRRPLHEALELGFRGVEVDLFLIDGQLRAGHDRGEARSGGAFEFLYLAPLDSVVSRCGMLTADSLPFLLAIELKQSSPAANDTLLQLLGRYPRLFSQASTGKMPAIEVVLVGWSSPDSPLPIHFRLAARKTTTLTDPAGRVRMISVDYGKAIGPWWSNASVRRQWLATLRSVKASSPGRLLRVHNLPPDAKVYRVLLDAGVDLIGVRDLARAADLFALRPAR